MKIVIAYNLLVGLALVLTQDTFLYQLGMINLLIGLVAVGYKLQSNKE